MSNNTIGPRVPSGSSGLDMLKDALGVGSNRSPASSSASSSGADHRKGLNAPRGQRMLPADYPVEALDRSAPRGTYLDLLV